MLTISEILQEITKYFVWKGYPLEKSTDLISPAFPSTFNPSAAHCQVMELIGQKCPLEKPRKFFVVEQCFRHVDIDKVGRSHHSSSFQMAAYVFGAAFASLSKKEIIETGYNYLVKELGLDSNKLLITTFGGGKVKNQFFESDEDSFRVWKELGILQNKLLPVAGPRNFIYLQREGDAAGPRSEIYYDRGEKYDVDRYVEIASIIFETHRFSKGQLAFSNNVVAGGAFGVERLLMVLNGFRTIYETDIFTSLVSTVENFVANRTLLDLFRYEIYTIVDFLKSAVLIINAGQLPDNSKRGEILKKLIRVMVKNVMFLGIESGKIYEDLVNKTVELYKRQYPSLEEKREYILKIVTDRIYTTRR